MKKLILFLLLCASILFSLQSCAPSTNMAGSWKDPEYVKKDINKILTLAIAREAWGQKAFEYTLRDGFIDYGVEAIATIDQLPHGSKIEKGTFEKYFSDQDIDAVIVSRIVDVDEKTLQVYNHMYTIPYGYYNGFHSFYFAAYDYVYNPGYSVKSKTVRIETNLYDAESKKLVWSGISESVDPDDAFELIDKVTSLIIRELDSEGFIKK